MKKLFSITIRDAGKTAATGCTAVRETNISRHQGDHIEGHLETHQVITTPSYWGHPQLSPHYAMLLYSRCCFWQSRSLLFRVQFSLFSSMEGRDYSTEVNIGWKINNIYSNNEYEEMKYEDCRWSSNRI